MSDKLEFIQELLKSCTLPELKEDLDSLSIESEHFKEYRQALEHQLPQLYGFVQQNETWIWDCSQPENQEVHTTLLLLLCEITAPAAIYSLEDKYLLQHGDRMLQHHLKQLPDSIDRKILNYYHCKLRSNCWKRQLGAAHGFMRFVELRYSEHSQQRLSLRAVMTLEWLTFCLSVGLNFRECHEPAYKQLGAKIFQLMLQRANRADIRSLNIHSVVYDAILKNVHLMDTVPQTADIWNCLFNCLEFFEDIDSISWNKTDDMMEILIRNITLAPNAIVSICLLKFITRLGYYFSVNRKEIENKLNENLKETKPLTDCRVLCADNTSYTSFRWAKSLLEIFISEAHKLMAGANICRQLLQEMHRSYMVYILPIPLQIAQPHLITFWNKFTAALMEAIVIQQNDREVINLTKTFLETILWQLKSSPHGTKNQSMLLFHNSFEELLKQDIFNKVN